ncbi:hypothetical protein ILUMI_11013 [Ignelater luminosus]|uniref:Galectin domain-containing protein n=1 Tax=Ignelater luminosus TaxID=2038154 RepID=A0A8K0CWU6_IGNLU|nr:hypothetical protein ILUMI_11013 [Ignelater luminosus]
MPSSLLFAINNEGRVHTLSTSGSVWRELPYVGQEFKKLSAVPYFLWALGGDHQVYVYVHGLDIPIRVREESYENERWIPIEGFTSRLLPTDRYHFSSVDGTVDRAIDKIRLPSMAWQWEGDWQLELTLAGQPLDHNGWTYAVDFPAQYYPKKQWKSCVRRRLWVRSRRYSAMNSWCAIAPLHKDATTEPFIDISVGGQSVMGAEPGTMLVWAVTSHNRVMFRTGVTTKSPEGAKWISIPVPPGCEINQLSVGPTGLVWAALLDGRALVRIGVTRDSLSGDSWVEIRGPVDSSRIIQVSVGTCAVWAVTQDKQVWFRKGVKGEGAGISEELAAGCGWVEMVGRMSLVSVSANDQVWAVGADDRAIYFRTGVSTADLTGKRWRALHAPLQVSRTSSNASLNRDKFHRSCNSLNQRPHSISEITSGIAEWEEQSHSAPTAPTSLPVGDLTGKHFEAQLKNPKAWSPVRSVGSVVGTEAHPETDDSVWQAEDSGNSSLFYAEDEELCWAECEASWAWVEAGACTVDPAQLPNWFVEAGSLHQAELEQPWRLKILEDLRTRLPTQALYSNYHLAIDTTSWTHSGEARVSLNTPAFAECILQLEWVHTNGILTILNPDGATTMHQFSISDMTCVQCCSEPGSPRLALHTPHLSPSYMRLQFSSDTQMEEWQAHLANVCSQVHNISEKPEDTSIWAITNLGDIFVSNSLDTESSQQQDNIYIQEIDLAGKQVPLNLLLHAGCIPGSELILTGCIADDADRIAINLDAHSSYKLRHKAHTELQNTNLHFNPRFADDVIVRNSMIDGKWGEEERDDEIPIKRGQEFTLKLICSSEGYSIHINEKPYCIYKHRLTPYAASVLTMWGKVQPFKLIIKSPLPILDPKDLFWRQLGGHLRRIESCRTGVTWGIGYDHTAWVYNGGWGGSFYGSLDSHSVNPMTDSQDYRVYENQRWNPVTGYTSTGLPTDRHMWSDATGKQKRTRDQVKLLSMHWQWVSDWLIDFHVPGGVDREGWQYAMDFPSNYHANKQFTDYVRRRRWYRRCAIATTGPWQELGHTKLLDVSLEPVDSSADCAISVWALASGGQAMIRVGVSQSNPMGTVWEHVNSDQALSSISCGPYNQVWAIGKNGCAYWRVGIRSDKLDGDSWACVEPPSGAQLKQISVGQIGVWAVDNMGRLYVRKEVSHVFPEGTSWHCITADPPVLSSASNTSGFKQVSVGKTQVWAVTDGGVAMKRHGICPENPAGTGWNLGITGNWQHLSVRAL